MSRPFEATRASTVIEPRDTSDGISADGISRDGISAFIPVLILGLVFVAWFGFQAVQLRAEREAMRELMTSQDKQLQESKKLRDSLDAIAHGTAQLAEGGNPSARLLMDELKRRGVTIAQNAAPGAAAGVAGVPPSGGNAGTPSR